MNLAQTFLVSYIAPVLGLVLVFAITSLLIPIAYLLPIYGLAFLLMYFIHRVEKEDDPIDTNVKKQYQEKPSNCPRCNSTRIADIAYGLFTPNEELDRKIQSGEIILGGCTFNEDSPRWCCLDCKYTPNQEEYVVEENNNKDDISELQRDEDILWSDIDYSKLQEDINTEEPPEEYLEEMYALNDNDSLDDNELQDLEEELSELKERMFEMEQYIGELESEVERLQIKSDDF